MQFAKLKVTILSEADRSDPTNQLLVAAAKADVDGKPCAWRAMVFQTGNFHHDYELVTAELIKKVLMKPKNEVRFGELPVPELTFEVPDMTPTEPVKYDS
jgi:hypothetical protein